MKQLTDVKPLRPLFPELTDSQIKCVYWFFMGLENSGIAHILSISENTVRGHLEHAREKLHITSTSVLRQVVTARLLSPVLQSILQSDNSEN